MVNWHTGEWLVAKIDGLSAKVRNYSDDELRKSCRSLRYEVRSGRPLDEVLVPTFALVREAGRRTLGMYHYPVQLLGGIAMHFGSVAVMQTGEGKTLTATLPMVLASLVGEGAHLATANDYLAARDAGIMAPIYDSLGLTLGVVTVDSTRAQRAAAYRSDVTYSTAKEIGFDFLRDRLLLRQQGGDHECSIDKFFSSGNENRKSAVQRGFQFLLVDEADSILIDEARTPLIVSSLPDEIALAREALYRWSAEVAPEFQANIDYEVDPKSKQVSLSAEGRKRIRKTTHPGLLSKTPVLDIYEQVEQAIFVNENYIRDRQYVVREGEIVIVDEFTGRLAEGRKWRSGLHQAIEAREGVEISVETGEAARITIQDLCLRYERLAGMTGTAANSSTELRKIYGLHTVQVPTNRPPKRTRWHSLVFTTDDEKWVAVADEIASLHALGRPVLVGTRSIDKSERLAKLLDERQIEHQVLNARYLEREAEIVSQAGQIGKVTVATNMAGRGTDIKVSDEALELGGLHVICTELHESARIDRQLVGRCGRQGDPGSYRQFLSLEDELLTLAFGQRKVDGWLIGKSRRKNPARFEPLFQSAQRKIERRHFKSRKLLLHREKLRQEIQQEMGQDPYLDTAGS